MDSEFRHSSYFYNLGLAFRSTAERHPSRIALLYPDGNSLTYADLEIRTNRLAHYLLGKGVEKNSVIAIFSKKSINALSLMLSCLKIGAIYVNVDVSSPPDRIGRILEQCCPAVVFLDEEAGVVGTFDGGLEQRDVIHIDATFEAIISELSEDPIAETTQVTGADPAYIMFTSGSTGMPKGAVMSHANVLNLISWAQETFDIQPEDRLTNVNPIYFDNSVFDFYSSLFSGATLCPIGTELSKNPRDLAKTVESLACTIWFSVPSLLVYLLTMKAISKETFSSIRTIIFGGEGFPKPKLRELFGLLGNTTRLVNVYGPTECTCICSAHDIHQEEVADQTQLAPLGKMAPNFTYRIDPQTPQEARFGELLLSGPNVGLGYYRDERRTRDAFVEGYESLGYRFPTYRTGDLVKEDENGLLRFCGRVDNQIKHMGYRIELEEIEAALARIEGLHESAAVYKRYENGTGKIGAFVTGSSGTNRKNILTALKKLVPPYMVPSEIHILDELPKNQNGKIDRVSLTKVLT